MALSTLVQIDVHVLHIVIFCCCNCSFFLTEEKFSGVDIMHYIFCCCGLLQLAFTRVNGYFVQVWFLGENANYAAAEYAWDTSLSPAAGLLMLDSDKMVAAANSRNPTLAGALTRLQRCAFSGSWEVNFLATGCSL